MQTKNQSGADSTDVDAVQQSLEELDCQLRSQRDLLQRLLTVTPLSQERLISESLPEELREARQILLKAHEEAHLAQRALEQRAENPEALPLALALSSEAMPEVRRALRQITAAQLVEHAEQQAFQTEVRQASAAQGLKVRVEALEGKLTRLERLQALVNSAHQARAQVRELEQTRQTKGSAGLGGLLGRLLFGRSQVTPTGASDLEVARREETRAFERLQQEVLNYGYLQSVGPADLALEVTLVLDERDLLKRQLRAMPEQVTPEERQAKVNSRIHQARLAANRACEQEAQAWGLPSGEDIWWAFHKEHEALLPLVIAWHTGQQRVKTCQGNLAELLPDWPREYQHPERVEELQRVARTCDRLAERCARQRAILAALRARHQEQRPSPEPTDNLFHEPLPWAAVEHWHVSASVLWPFPQDGRPAPFPGLLPWQPRQPNHADGLIDERPQHYPSDVLRLAAQLGKRYSWLGGDNLLLADVLSRIRQDPERQDLEAALLIGLRPHSLPAVQILRQVWSGNAQNQAVWRRHRNRRLGSFWHDSEWDWYTECLSRRLTWADATQLVLQRWTHLTGHHPDELDEQDLRDMYDELENDLDGLRHDFDLLPFEEKTTVKSLLNHLVE